MLNLIVSPKSHNSKAEKVAKSTIKYLKAEKIEYAVYFCTDFDNLIENLKEVLSFGESEFVIIGDDITLSYFINNIKDISKIKLGIIPTGKYNDFANYLGISLHPGIAVKDIISKNIEQIDILQANDLKVLNHITIGASVEVEEKYNQYKIKNFISNKIANIKHGNNYQGIDLVLTSKDYKSTRKTTAFELIVANGGLGKRKNMSPLSNMQDGLFNLLYCDTNNKKNNAKYISSMSKGNHIYNEDTYQYWLSDLTVSNPNKSIKASIDGRIMNFEQLNISIIENGLKIMKNKE